MAKKSKKNENLTLEEKLEQALIPNWDEPYKLPDNWCWCKGKYIFRKMETKKPSGKCFSYIDIDAIDNTNQRVIEPKCLETAKAPSRASRALHCGDTLFSMVRPYLKNIAYIDDNLKDCIASTGFYICTPQKNVYDKYLFWLMTSPYVVDGINQYMKGDNSPSVRKDDMETFFYPIPPLAEQQRIVDRIERIFSKLDEVKANVQNIIDGFENRKAAILHKAFNGELTAKWRKENKGYFNEWKQMNLQSVCSMKITDGTHKTPIYCKKENGIPFVSAKDVTSGKISWDNIKYIIPELHKELYERLAPQLDDVLLAKNGTTGIAAIVDVEKIFDVYVTLSVLRPNKDIINPYYLLNVVNSPICKKQFDEHLTGIGVPNLHLRDIKEVMIPVPPPSEQKEIVRILDNLLEKEQRTKEKAEEVSKRIELIKKSILARAFRGELGTNNPDEESAIELLKEILSECADNKKKATIRTVVPKEIAEKLTSDLERRIIKCILKNEQGAEFEEILSVSSKKFDVLYAVRDLEKRKIIVCGKKGKYILER